MANTGYTPSNKTCRGFSGELTEDGAKLIDPTGTLEAKIPVCPPEGDAATGDLLLQTVLLLIQVPFHPELQFLQWWF